MPVKVEEKLYQNRYRIDAGRPHITIKEPQTCATRCALHPCTICCPAGCYTLEGDGHVVLITDGCLECGTCRIICDEHHNVIWEWPRGGFGISFKFG